MTRKPDPRRDVPEEGGPDPTEDPILYLAERQEEEEG
jgi:hypothetical protein